MSFEFHTTQKGYNKVTYLCDRCGKTKVKKYTSGKKMKPLPKKWGAAHITYLSDTEPTRYDLCPECVKKFIVLNDLIDIFSAMVEGYDDDAEAAADLIDNFAKFYIGETSDI